MRSGIGTSPGSSPLEPWRARATSPPAQRTCRRTLARHAETTLNVARVVNGDPAVDAPLTEKGRSQAERLGRQVENVPLDSCIVTRFRRTHDTAEIALAGRDVPIAVEPLLGDVDVGDLEGLSLDDYRAWKLAHGRAEPFPNAKASTQPPAATAKRSSGCSRGPRRRSS